MKKLLALTLALILALSALPALAEDISANVFQTDYTGKTVILHTNDVHGAVAGYAYIPALRSWMLSHGAEDVLVVDAGDFSQGDPYVADSKGMTAIELMNAAGYDVVTLGNHEFDYGYDNLKENLSKAEFTPICANVLIDATGEPILESGALFTFYPKDGDASEAYLRVGFVGLETPETATKVNPALIKEIRFTPFEELYTYAQKAADAARENGADLVIGLFHLGVNAEGAPHRSLDVLAHTTGYDFVIDGHSHTVMTNGQDGAPIQSTGTKFANIGVVVIDNETKTIENHFLVSTAGLEKDPEVMAKAQAIMDEVDTKYGTPFATTEVLLNGERSPGNRTGETNLGDLIADALVWSVVKEGGIEQVEPNHVVGITNGGGIRATIQPGDVTMKDIKTVMPFGNTVAVVYVKGTELLEALEASTFCTPDPIGGYPQVSGIVFTIDTAKAFDQGDLYYDIAGKETTYYGPKSIQRVTIESINGEPFDPEATYAVVTNNFCQVGGDTYNSFARAYLEGSTFDTGIPMDQVVIDYITDVLGGVITAEAYGEPQGREIQK